MLNTDQENTLTFQSVYHLFTTITSSYVFFLALRIVASMCTNVFYGYSRQASPHLSHLGKLFWIHALCFCCLSGFIVVSAVWNYIKQYLMKYRNIEQNSAFTLDFNCDQLVCYLWVQYF